ncbi:MAG TPA: HypC/HybG/HupF family hydrogenase formation chaperone [Candidatus Baltobacteraceae bacterium]|nr:HypC/HybG/HupF family hydrogenase formation chaperone [Candidatus Baltobacteraceae bacterium]
MPNTSEGCTTCGDTAVALRILERTGSRAVCAGADGERSVVELDFVPDATTGDVVLVHFGVAIARAQREV